VVEPDGPVRCVSSPMCTPGTLVNETRRRADCNGPAPRLIPPSPRVARDRSVGAWAAAGRSSERTCLGWALVKNRDRSDELLEGPAPPASRSRQGVHGRGAAACGRAVDGTADFRCRSPKLVDKGGSPGLATGLHSVLPGGALSNQERLPPMLASAPGPSACTGFGGSPQGVRRFLRAFCHAPRESRRGSFDRAGRAGG